MGNESRPCIRCGRLTESGFLSDEGLCDNCWEKLGADDDNACSCPACDEVNYPMGTLGSIIHYRCRACGLEYSYDPRTKN